MNDSNVERVRTRLHERSQVGIQKYGVTTERAQLTHVEWLRHLQDELLDGAVYVEAALNRGSPSQGLVERLRTKLGEARNYLEGIDLADEIDALNAEADAYLSTNPRETGSKSVDGIEQRARELLDSALREIGLHEDAYHIGCGGDLDPFERASISAIAAALRSAEKPFVNLGDSEAQFIADGRDLNCPACGGSGHVDDVQQPATPEDSSVVRKPCVSALEVFRIAGGDTECTPRPSAELAIECLRDLRACYDELLLAKPSAPEQEYVAVPREYTDLMIEQGAAAIEAYRQAVGEHASAEALAGIAYDVMIAYAPPAPRSDDAQERVIVPGTVNLDRDGVNALGSVVQPAPELPNAPEPMAMAVDGQLFWKASPADWRGANFDLFRTHPAPRSDDAARELAPAITESQVIALVAGPHMYHHKMDDAAEREAKSFDRCRELTIRNIKTFFAARRAMAGSTAPREAAQAQPDGASFDLERMLMDCVPGGSICDPQHVADAIREWFSSEHAIGVAAPREAAQERGQFSWSDERHGILHAGKYKLTIEEIVRELNGIGRINTFATHTAPQQREGAPLWPVTDADADRANEVFDPLTFRVTSGDSAADLRARMRDALEDHHKRLAGEGA